MATSIAALADFEQAKLSGEIRVALKRRAAGMRGGLRTLAQEAGLPYARAWNQLNRGNGVLADLIAALAQVGIDDPLRMVADAAGYDVAPKPKFLRRKGQPTPIRAHEIDLHHAAADVTQRIEKALVDQAINARERERIKSALHALRLRMAELEAHIDGRE